MSTHWLSLQANGVRVFFAAVTSKGTLRTGLVAGDFTVTVIAPDDADSANPSVTESSQLPGAYFFDIPSAFLLTNGTGMYGCIAEVTAAAPPLDAVTAFSIRVDEHSLDELAQIERGRWRIVGTQMIFFDSDGVTPLRTFNLFDQNGNPTGNPANVFERVPV